MNKCMRVENRNLSDYTMNDLNTLVKKYIFRLD